MAYTVVKVLRFGKHRRGGGMADTDNAVIQSMYSAEPPNITVFGRIFGGVKVLINVDNLNRTGECSVYNRIFCSDRTFVFRPNTNYLFR